jgi:RNA-binding protein YlmH
VNHNLSTSQSVFNQVRRHILCCMETGQVDMARTALTEYKAAAEESDELVDMSEDLRIDVVNVYGVSL